ncbi:helix-turn-helix domain-containing protein [Streptomyces griseus]|uniref:helix-turn-helix domain-containing protein n=1 Tax=Streptomyces griseus TaxID=1911 RepID=UPI000569B1D2|nr:helix-turn-helix domain-containing protein [Streptomyces griseus]
MKELAGRLTAVDPDAGAAVRVIAYFDRLAESRAGMEALVRGAAVLSGVAARLVDADRLVRIRIEADGTRRDTALPPDPVWPSAALTPGGAPALWLERTEAPPSVVDAVILERAAGAVRLVLDRTRGRAPVDDPALVETVLDATAPEAARLHAARRLGLDPGTRARALAPLGGRPRVVSADVRIGEDGHRGQDAAGRRGETAADRPRALSPHDGHLRAAAGSAGAAHAGPTRADAAVTTIGRLGVGPAVPLAQLPGSWAAARTALRFTAADTAQDPGPRVVYADELGGLALLADLVAPGAEPPPDVRALDAAAADVPWLLVTLHAVATTGSLRAAAAEANVHHSTLQDRLTHAEHLLGWPVRTPQGRLRLHLALEMRRLARP